MIRVVINGGQPRLARSGRKIEVPAYITLYLEPMGEGIKRDAPQTDRRVVLQFGM